MTLRSRPPPPRIVDGINVRRPEYYGDTGGPGWYAEAQFPVRRRLAVVYKKRWERDVYIRPTELIVPALKQPVDLESFKERFRGFNLLHAELMDRSSVSVMLAFPTGADAEAALQYVEDLRARRECTFRIDTPEVNVVGRSAFTLDDILLVREEWAHQQAPIDNHVFHTLSTIIEASPNKDRRSVKRRISQPLLNEDEDEKPASKRPRGLGAGETGLHDKPINHYKLEHVSPPNPFDQTHHPSSALLTPPYSACPLPGSAYSPDRPWGMSGHSPMFESLRHFSQDLQLSSHISYTQAPLPPFPSYFAIIEGRLAMSHSAEHIHGRYPGLPIMQAKDLPPGVLDQLGLERVEGYRWKVKYETQEAWRLGGGYVELSPRW